MFYIYPLSWDVRSEERWEGQGYEWVYGTSQRIAAPNKTYVFIMAPANRS